MGYLCKYLKLNGWYPVVVTEYIDESMFDFLKDDIDVTYIRYYTKKGLAGKIEWLWKFMLDALFGYKNERMYHEAVKQTLKHDFKLVLCSSYRTFPLPAAMKVAQKTKLPLIVDLRDIIEQYSGNEFITYNIPKLWGLEKILISYFKKSNLKSRTKVLEYASCVTTVSPWHVETLSRFNKNTSLIYNGFDSELFYPVNIRSDVFFVTYTGRLLSTSMRNPELLFQAVQRLADDDVIKPELFRLRWYVDDKSRYIISESVSVYPKVKDYMQFYGTVPASAIPEILNESSVLLLLTNKATVNGPKGVMTTKFFESLAVERPILCVRGDEGCLEEAINNTRSGLSAHSVEQVYDFLKEYFQSWKSGEILPFRPDRDEIAKFSRAGQTKQFISLFEQTI
jgi:hypothetical protein